MTGRELRNLRKRAYLSVQDVAELMDLAIVTWYFYEAGRLRIPNETLRLFKLRVKPFLEIYPNYPGFDLELLRKIQKAIPYRQKQISKLLGVSVYTWRSWTYNLRKMPIAKWHKLLNLVEKLTKKGYIDLYNFPEVAPKYWLL